jgi:hypothetical protein
VNDSDALASNSIETQTVIEPLHSLLYTPLCSICSKPMYRHPIILWALRCLLCDG